MQLEERAAIDADFVNHLLKSKLSFTELVDCLKCIFLELKLQVVVHPLVYDKEFILAREEVSQLFRCADIKVVEWSSILQGDEGAAAYYVYLVKEFFYKINGCELSFAPQNVFSEWVAKKNLGESHTLAMCLLLPCGIFLSDDGDSKKLMLYIQTRFARNLVTYNRRELVDKYVLDGGKHLTRGQRRSLGHA